MKIRENQKKHSSKNEILGITLYCVHIPEDILACIFPKHMNKYE